MQQVCPRVCTQTSEGSLCRRRRLLSYTTWSGHGVEWPSADTVRCVHMSHACIDSLRLLREGMQIAQESVCLLKYDARPHLVDHLSIDSPRCLLAGVLDMDNPAHHLQGPPRRDTSDGHTNLVYPPTACCCAHYACVRTPNPTSYGCSEHGTSGVCPTSASRAGPVSHASCVCRVAPTTAHRPRHQ